MSRLRTLVSGLADVGDDLCAAVQASSAFRLVAVADTDRRVGRRIAERVGAEAFDDHRRALLESRADVWFTAQPPFQRGELLKLAAQRGVAVLATSPPLISLSETVHAVERFATARTPISVVRVWQPEPAYVRLCRLEMLAGRLFSAHVNVVGRAIDAQGWRGDSARAGGGVLLYDAYVQIDALVSIFGMPDDVLAVLPTADEPSRLRSYDTEDAATVMMRFAGNRVATVNARRIGTRFYWRYRLHGARATVVITPEELTISTGDERPPSTSKVRTTNRFSPAVSAFGMALASGLKDAVSPLRDHIRTMAVIETAYHSVRTGEPESPARRLRIAAGAELDLNPARSS